LDVAPEEAAAEGVEQIEHDVHARVLLTVRVRVRVRVRLQG